jgi:2-methylisocitrate lyase-like PEP mutase family enzyme
VLPNLADDRDLLRSLHVPGRPLVLPNAWDAASAKAVVAAGFPVVATSSGGVAEALGYEDHEGAPAEEMLAAAARIARSVDVPVTVDAEAGYGLDPPALVGELTQAGAAGCNLEDTDHATGNLRNPAEQAAWLRSVREADTTLVINARIDVFLLNRATSQSELVDAALERARAYVDAGADCVYPILLSDHAAIEAFVAAAEAPVNVLVGDDASLRKVAELGVARASYGTNLFRQTLQQLETSLRAIARASKAGGEA